jgi:hypothetical protein
VSAADHSPEFLAALIAALKDHERYGRMADADFTEVGSLRVVGIARSDALRLAMSLQDTYGLGLATGWDCPNCGKLRDADGNCPDGCEFEPQSPEAGRLTTLLAVAEFCLAIGVHLERARWTDASP